MSEKDKIGTILIVLGLAFISVGIYAHVYSVPIFSLDWPRPPLLTYPHREKAPLILSGIILIILGVILRHAGGGEQIDRSKEERRTFAEVRRPTSISIVAAPNLFDQRYDVPYIPTSPETAERMLEMAEVGPADVICDLGCGDARLLVLAVELFKAKKAVGYEIRKEVYKAALQEVEALNLREKVTIVNGDLFNADLSEATVITLYLTQGANKKLKPKLEREARPGTRIVSHDYEMPGWQPTRKERRNGDTIYLYTTPDSPQAPKTYKKLNKDLLRLQKILHTDYLDLEKAFTHMNDGNCTVIDGKYVYRRGRCGKSPIISVWTKPSGEPGAKCLFNAPIAL